MSRLLASTAIRVDPPGPLTAPAPAEARGMARDDVRMMVVTGSDLTHARFRDLPDHLEPGDLVVVNNSATVAGQVDAHHEGYGPVVLHVAAPLDDGTWVVELRTAPHAALAVLTAATGERVRAGDVDLTLLEPYPHENSSPTGSGNRLWRVSVDGDLPGLLDEHGRPISYGYLDRVYPLSMYQSVFAAVPGSAEMPSAGRPFTDSLVTRLVARGIGVAPITLHTGVSSQEVGEGPQPERFDVSAATARMVNATREAGGRVVAVGTTVTRALESAVSPEGWVEEARGWTKRVVTPDEPPQVVDGLITGWHDPQASHLLLVESIGGTGLTQRAYDAATAERYQWHEFGDSALLLPPRRRRDRAFSDVA